MKDILVSDKSLDLNRCMKSIQDDGAGGNVCFIGTVRNTTGKKTVRQLEFEAYVPMALKEMDKIADYILTQWPVMHVCIHHRIGNLNIGEIPVIIAVAAAHRQAAFEGCQYAIDTLKVQVPIWKKEIYNDGSEWVAAHP